MLSHQSIGVSGVAAIVLVRRGILFFLYSSTKWALNGLARALRHLPRSRAQSMSMSHDYQQISHGLHDLQNFLPQIPVRHP